MIRVALVDDQELVRTGLAMVIDGSEGMRVVAQAGDGEQALDELARTPADVVLMDIRMPRMNGVDATAKLTAQPRAPKVIVLTTFDLDEYVFGALRAGAAGFLVKSTPPEDLIGLVQVAAEGHTVLSPVAAQRLVAASSDRDSARDRAQRLVGSLTERETEVLTGLGDGLSNAQIAARLYLSEATVKGYVSRMLDKLGCANRTQAGLLAHEAGLTNR